MSHSPIWDPIAKSRGPFGNLRWAKIARSPPTSQVGKYPRWSRENHLPAYVRVLDGDLQHPTYFKDALSQIFSAKSEGRIAFKYKRHTGIVRKHARDRYAKGYPRAHATSPAQNLASDRWHEIKVRIAEGISGESKGRFARIGYILVDGEVEDPFKGLDPLQRIDEIWRTIEQPLKVQLEDNRWQYSPETMKRLRDGTPLRIVMLGDSIVGDTSSSKYELLLQRLYPRAKITKILSNRGSTGCWWYKEENRVDGYVLKHNPHFLMIGGNSNRDDTEAIRAVIRQVRAHKPGCEVMLMTPAFGASNDPHIKNWRYEIASGAGDYRAPEEIGK